MSENKPIHTINFGTLSSSIWLNSDPDLKFPTYRVCYTRTFKDSKDTWSKSKYFTGMDIPVLFILVLSSYQWIQKHKQEDRSELTMPPIERPVNDDEELDST